MFSAAARYEDAALAPRSRVAPGEVFIRFVSVSQTSRFDHNPPPRPALLSSSRVCGAVSVFYSIFRVLGIVPRSSRRAANALFQMTFSVFPLSGPTTSTMPRVMALLFWRSPESVFAFPRACGAQRHPRLLSPFFALSAPFPHVPPRTAPPSRFLIAFLVFLAPFPSSSAAALATFLCQCVRGAQRRSCFLYSISRAPGTIPPTPLHLGGAKSRSPRVVPSSQPFFCILQIPAMRGRRCEWTFHCPAIRPAPCAALAFPIRFLAFPWLPSRAGSAQRR
ncbi:hypothetical protein C8J57DRAFT_231563 [Mycena rebaudengoi]|nr:hypothetical protein C8J57DRAFT_231563 [Mycena rebaudengoi]